MSITVPMQGFGGGVPLNFKVVGNPKPTNPKENTIWLNTDVKITGYYFQEEQPADMKQGEVFILTGAKSYASFNALKKNTVKVLPLRAVQMKSGTMTNVDAEIYQNGKWERWVYVVDLDVNTWSRTANVQVTNTYTNSGGKLVLKASQDSNVYKNTGIFHKTPIDLTGYTACKVNLSYKGNGNDSMAVGLTQNKDLSFAGDATVKYTYQSNVELNKTINLDVSNLTGNYYIMLSLRLSGNGRPSMTVSSIEFE